MWCCSVVEEPLQLTFHTATTPLLIELGLHGMDAAGDALQQLGTGMVGKAFCSQHLADRANGAGDLRVKGAVGLDAAAAQAAGLKEEAGFVGAHGCLDRDPCSETAGLLPGC